MKLKNTTEWPDYFLRRMVAWCCHESGLPVRRLREATFRNCAYSFSGHAYGSMRIVCSVGRSGFPASPDTRPGMSGEIIADRMEALIAIASHEIEHCCQYAERRSAALKKQRWSELVTRQHEVATLRKFREHREQLLTEWSEVPTPRASKSKPTQQERNEAKAREMLATWERKLKLAKTKVTAYKRKCRYYDRVAANRTV
jgi:hypothetical protein